MRPSVTDVSARLRLTGIGVVTAVQQGPSNDATAKSSKFSPAVRPVVAFQTISSPAGETKRCSSKRIADAASRGSPGAGPAYKASVRVWAWPETERNRTSAIALSVSDMVTLTRDYIATRVWAHFYLFKSYQCVFRFTSMAASKGLPATGRGSGWSQFGFPHKRNGGV